MERNKVWTQRGKMLFLSDLNSPQQPKLDNVVYKLMVHPALGFYVEPIAEKFEFSYKIYGMQSDFVKRVVRTYQNTAGTLGVLMNGVKGTGKTICSEILSNEFIDMGLPVIIVPEKYEDVQHFFNDLTQDVCIVFDEFEKMYNDYDHSLLSVMSGILENGYRKVYLLTTNKSHINENMKQRPGRIRYIKNFADLDLNTIIEIVDDMLKHKQHREETIDFISKLSMITVDIVKAIVTEVNIHNEGPSVFKDVFNVEVNKETANIYEIKANNKLISWFTAARTSHMSATIEDVGCDFYINNKYFGDIISVEKDNILLITDARSGAKEGATMKIKIDPLNTKHEAFVGYAF